MFLTIIIICSTLNGISGYDRKFFCENQEKLCEGLPNRHTGCGNGKWAACCSAERSVVSMSDDFKNFLLEIHNKARSETARGKMGCSFGQATRMATMQWDQTLADLAENTVKKCTMHHSDCLNTPEYKQVGQNIGFQSTTGDFIDDKEAAKTVITQWIDEYKIANAESIRSNPDCGGPNIYHYLTIVTDRNIAVGCAMSRYIDDGFKTNLIVCNYAALSVNGIQVYDIGRRASRCNTGESPDYKGLCSTDEQMDPNNFNWRKCST